MASDLIIKLVHFNNLELEKAWLSWFRKEPNVQIFTGDILEVESDALVSPGNSFGFMDGGLDLQISRKYGWGVQTELKKRIAQLPLKELLVGQAESIAIKNKTIICAPTMRIPTSHLIPESTNAYLAMKAVMNECLRHNLKSVSISGLCTGTGRMAPEVCAKQMYKAYAEVIKNEIPEFPVFIDAVRYHKSLISTNSYSNSK